MGGGFQSELQQFDKSCLVNGPQIRHVLLSSSLMKALKASLDTAPDARRRALAVGLLGAPLVGRAAKPLPQPSVPVLLYHRFAATAVDSMTVRTNHFAAQLRLLEQLNCNVIALADWVAWRSGKRATLPPRAVVLTADDGHRSQFEVMAPLLHARGWPITLFVYPSAISNARYAMTWAQLQELAAQPGFSVQSHTYWHPNLLQERRRLPPEVFRRFANDQLRRSREVIEQRLAHPVSLLAWPFGLNDEALWAQAAECGYQAAVALGNRAATLQDPLYAVPRHLMVDSIDVPQLAARLRAAFTAGEAA